MVKIDTRGWYLCCLFNLKLRFLWTLTQIFDFDKIKKNFTPHEQKSLENSTTAPKIHKSPLMT